MAEKNHSLILTFLAVFLIFLFTFLNILPVITQIAKTPPGMVSLQVTHWGGDYFYYLSQFKQGQKSWFLSSDLYTSDFSSKTLVGWENVFIGRIFHIFGGSSLLAYHASLVVFSALFLFLSFYLLIVLFRNQKEGKKIAFMAFVLFLFSNAFPKMAWEGGKLGMWFYDHWFNIGLPLTRLGGVPHHLIERTLIVAVLILFLRKLPSDGTLISRILFYLLSIVTGFALATIEPVHFLLLCAVVTFSSFFMKKNRLFSLLFVIAGVPPVIYLKELFLYPPFIQLARWEAAQAVSKGLVDYILSSGPLVIFSAAGICFYLIHLKRVIREKRKVPQDFPIFVFLVISTGIFFSPLPEWANISPIRFLPTVLPLFWAYFSIRLFLYLKIKRIISVCIFIFILAVMIAPLAVQIKKANEFDTQNLLYYIPVRAMDLYTHVDEISSERDVFLVYWPFNDSFPAFTGRTVYQGHPLLTTDSAEKERKLFEFFDGKLSDTEAFNFLHTNRITQVIGYSGNPTLKSAVYLTLVEDNGYLSWYRVKI